ncbi:MAG: hypothetical protein AAB784_01105 [Patescibacteria group bacterium]
MTPSPFIIPGLETSPQINFGTDLAPQFAQVFDGVLKYFQTVNYVELVASFKTISIIASVVFGVILIWIIIKSGDLYKNKVKDAVKGSVESLTPPPAVVTAYDNRWQEIRRHVDSFVEAEWKLAVIEADKFVDDVLKTAGFAGESMGERLMLIKPDQIINIQYLWDAHKLRNLLVHDANFRLTHQQAIFAINAFESVLKELSALT